MEQTVKQGLLSVVLPAFNEEASVPRAADTLSALLEGAGIDHEIVFVDDGSRDGTLRLLKELAAQDERVVYLSFSRNFGKEAAMYAGLKNARGDYVAIMDADMQDPPSLLPEMFRLMEEGYDSVATRRVSRAGLGRVASGMHVLQEGSGAPARAQGTRQGKSTPRALLACASSCEPCRVAPGPML